MSTRPDMITRLRRIAALAAFLLLVLLCLHLHWTWALFAAALINLTEPAWRAQLFRPAAPVTGLFVLAALGMFVIPVSYFFWAAAHVRPFLPEMPAQMLEALFFLTVTLAGLLLRRKANTALIPCKACADTKA